MGNLAIDGGDTVGERIRAAYLAKGMNRSQFVRALGVAYTTVIAWERDEFVPGAENLQAIAGTRRPANLRSNAGATLNRAPSSCPR